MALGRMGTDARHSGSVALLKLFLVDTKRWQKYNQVGKLNRYRAEARSAFQSRMRGLRFRSEVATSVVLLERADEGRENVGLIIDRSVVGG